MNLPSKASPTPVLHPLDLSPIVATLGEFFASRGVEAYLVGGAVRDALLGRTIGDIDVAVAPDSQDIGRGLASSLEGRFVLLDEARGIVRVIVGGGGSASCVDLSPMDDGITEDLGRRDFTIDAMALPLADAFDVPATVADPYDGLSDLRAGVVRSVNLGVFASDPARLLRAPRLAARLRFKISEETARQIRRDAHLITTIAPERIRDELLKLLVEPDATDSLRCLDDLGLLCRVIPELDDARDVTQPKEHYWDVFNHLLETVGQIERVTKDPLSNSPSSHGGENITPSPLMGEGQDEGEEASGIDESIEATVPRFERMGEYFAQEVSDGHTRLTLLKLTGLLHDIAKPATRTVEESGRIRFLGHHTLGAEMAEKILKRLRLSGRGVELARTMVQNHLRPGQMSQSGEVPTGRAIFRYFRDVGDAAIDTLYLNMADYLAARGPDLGAPEWSEYCRMTGYILQEGLQRKAPESLPQLINGYDIMKSFSLDPGPKVGLLLTLVSEAQSDGEITTRDEALELVKANLYSRNGGA